MQLIQYIGPFAAGKTFSLPAQMGYRYTHIGLQVPYRQPISLINSAALPIDISINGVQYRVNDKDILEFDGMRETSLEIEIEDDLPWGSIIDIAREEQQN